MKKTIKLTKVEELNFEILMYQDECFRLRKLLRKEYKTGTKNMMSLDNMNLLKSVTAEEDRKQL